MGYVQTCPITSKLNARARKKAYIYVYWDNIEETYLIMLSLLIIRPLPGISVSTMSNFRVMKITRVELKQNRVKLYVKKYIYTHRHMHTFFLLRNHCAFILSSIQFLQDCHQLSDTSCESIREQTREWKYWIHSDKILALSTARFLLLTHISPRGNGPVPSSL